jgi:AcrR family transcriptional regulator
MEHESHTKSPDICPAGQASACAETRQRLIEAAAAVFAEVGYQAATVREICRRAGANIAAVNYHFGDKERLYREILCQGAHMLRERYPMGEPEFAPDRPAEERLREFIHRFLRRILSANEGVYYGKLMSREMIDPTPALDMVLDEIIRPLINLLTGILRDMLGERASDKTLRYCSQSIIGQCVFYHHCRPVISRLLPDQTFEAEDIEGMAEHIYQFSLAGVRKLAQ